MKTRERNGELQCERFHSHRGLSPRATRSTVAATPAFPLREDNKFFPLIFCRACSILLSRKTTGAGWDEYRTAHAQWFDQIRWHGSHVLLQLVVKESGCGSIWAPQSYSFSVFGTRHHKSCHQVLAHWEVFRAKNSCMENKKSIYKTTLKPVSRTSIG